MIYTAVVGLMMFTIGFLVSENHKENIKLEELGCTCKKYFLYILVDEDCSIHGDTKK